MASYLIQRKTRRKEYADLYCLKKKKKIDQNQRERLIELEDVLSVEEIAL